MMLSVFFFRPILLRNSLQLSGTANKKNVYLTDGNGSEHIDKKENAFLIS